MKYRLGVNIDHVATLRNARGGKNPSVLIAAKTAIQSGANSITVHLREDQRHIKKEDVILLKKKITKPLNLEMAMTREMINFAKDLKPTYVCIVPEKRKELTTEGGLNLNHNKILLRTGIKELKKKGIKICLFIDPKIKDVKEAKNLDVDNVELHTGSFCNLIEQKNYKKANLEFIKLKKASYCAYELNLGIHCGHGLDFKTTKKLKTIKEISEYNIGHFIISNSIFSSLSKTVKNFLKIIK